MANTQSFLYIKAFDNCSLTLQCKLRLNQENDTSDVEDILLVPVLMKTNPSDIQGYPPLALISHVMKVLDLLQHPHSHPEKNVCTVRSTTFDFQPQLLVEKLRMMGMHWVITSWITDYLTDRPQLQTGLIYRESEAKQTVTHRGQPWPPSSPPVGQTAPIPAVTSTGMGKHVCHKSFQQFRELFPWYLFHLIFRYMTGIKSGNVLQV